MDVFSKSKIAILVMVIGTMFTTSSLVTNAYAAPKGGVIGSGVVLFTCGDGTRVDEALSFRMEALREQGKNKFVGSFELRDSHGGLIEGDINGGKTGKTSFSLLSNYLDHVGLCTDDSIPSKGTITGTCGNTVQLELKFENGANGEGIGNFDCSK